MKFIPGFFNIALCFVCLASQAQNTEAFFKDVDAFMKKYVSQGSVAYAALKKDAAKLKALTQAVANFKLDGVSTLERKAFYINAYNIMTINQIIQHYPVKSPRDIAGFWDKSQHKIAGEMMTLNHLEHKKLLGEKKDPRLHFVLVCAAKGCPQLASFGYTPAKLEKQLTSQTSKILNSDFIKVNDKSKTVEVSEIFKWYGSDFASGTKTYKNFIKKYKTLDLGYNFKYYTYDWSLNSQASK